MGWSYVCRTALSTTATWEGETFRLDVLGACLRPERLIALQEAYVTREAYGPIMVGVVTCLGRAKLYLKLGFKGTIDPGKPQVQEMIKTVLTPTHPTPLNRCWMSHLQALSTIPLPRGNPNALYVS